MTLHTGSVLSRRWATSDGPEVVLLAEDDDQLRGRLSDELRDHGYVVVETSDALEVEDYLGLASEKGTRVPAPDVIVCDAQMPGYSGIEFLARMRQAGITTPVILLDGTGSHEVYEQAERLGAEFVLEMPLVPEELSTAVDLAA